MPMHNALNPKIVVLLRIQNTNECFVVYLLTLEKLLLTLEKPSLPTKSMHSSK